MNTGYALPRTAAHAPVILPTPHTRLRDFARRIRALLRLAARRRRARRRYDDLRHLDDRTLRDLGVTRSEVPSIVAELDGRAAATRRRTDSDVWQSAPARFRVRAVDSSL